MTDRRERGFALIAALWALALVGALAAAYLAEARHVVRVSANRDAELSARLAALTGLERAHNALERLQVLSADEAGLDVESRQRLRAVWNRLDLAFAEVAEGCVGAGCYALRVRDLGTTLNVNLASEVQLRALFMALDFDERDADIASQSISDWIDADDLHRARGAERDYYQTLTFPYEPRNASIVDIDELLRVRGLDGPVLELVRPYLSLEGDGKLNLNAAPAPVLATLPGLGPEGIRVLLDARRRGIFFSTPFELSLRLSPEARARLLDSMAEFMRSAEFEPRRIEVESRGHIELSGIAVRYTAVYLRAGERVALVRRFRKVP